MSGGEAGEQQRDGSWNRLVGPLALGLTSQVAADLGEGDLDRPPPDETR
jgi:hypothetical protein